MSVINNALTNLTDKEESKASPLKPAEIPKVKRSGKLAWAVGGFALSVAVGGWAVSTQFDSGTEAQEVEVIAETQAEPVKAAQEQEKEPVIVVASKPSGSDAANKIKNDSPTSKRASGDTIEVYSSEVAPAVKSKPVVLPEKTAQITPKAPVKQKVVSKPKPVTTKQVTVKKAEAQVQRKVVKPVAKERPLEVAQVAPASQVAGNMSVEHVELSPEQVASNAVERAKRALDANDLDTAIKEYETALKYRPLDDRSRRKLSALYYGKKNLRKSVDILRKGIRLDEKNQKLRIALSQMLLREGQPEAALSPLVYMPDQPQIDYLSLRAGIAQKIKNNAIALEAYQELVEREGDNARWWLGLGIQQERSQMHKEAIHSYSQALSRVGVSKKTQSFIRERLSLLKSLEEKSSAN